MIGFKEYKVVWFKKGDTEGVELDSIKSIRVTKVSSAKSNSSEIVLNNYSNKSTLNGELLYNVDDILKIYAADGFVDTNVSSHLLGVYFIKNVNFAPENKTITIICGDHTFDLLNKISFGDFRTSTSPTITKEIIDTNLSNGSDGQTATLLVTDMDSTKSNGGSFKIIDYATVNKTTYEVVADLAQPDYTGDIMEYLFWFDENNVFHWHYPNMVINSQKLYYGQSPVISLKGTRAESDTISSVIYNAGNDLNDAPILNFYHDSTSTSTNIKYFAMTDIEKVLKRQYTDGAGGYTISNEYFLELAKQKGDAQASNIIRKVGTGLWEATINVEGGIYAIGSLYEVGDNLNNFPSQRLRVNKVVHKMDKNGWSTTLTLKEDPKEQQ